MKTGHTHTHTHTHTRDREREREREREPIRCTKEGAGEKLLFLVNKQEVILRGRRGGRKTYIGAKEQRKRQRLCQKQEEGSSAKLSDKVEQECAGMEKEVGRREKVLLGKENNSKKTKSLISGTLRQCKAFDRQEGPSEILTFRRSKLMLGAAVSSAENY